MSEKTPIEWCDSSVNPVMGCDGCELWLPEKGVEHCYAGTLHKIRAGRPGYADRFDEPKLFPGRMAKAAAWSDLRGKERPDKPWLNGMPRMIFVSDMGDALSRGVPLEYLRDEAIAAAASEKGQRHLWLWLTKQPQRMLELYRLLAAQGINWPANLWAGTSVTSAEQTARIKHLLRIPAPVRFVSYEPALGPVDFSRILLKKSADLGPDITFSALRGWFGGAVRPHEPPGRARIDWVICGGESGPGARPCALEWLQDVREQCAEAGVPFFAKQLGAFVVSEARAASTEDEFAEWKRHGLKSADAKWPADRWGWRMGTRERKGGDAAEFPEDLRVREVPAPGLEVLPARVREGTGT